MLQSEIKREMLSFSSTKLNFTPKKLSTVNFLENDQFKSKRGRNVFDN